MKTYCYMQMSETSETHYFLRFRRSALQKWSGVGNVGNIYRFPTFLHPLLRRMFLRGHS